MIHKMISGLILVLLIASADRPLSDAQAQAPGSWPGAALVEPSYTCTMAGDGAMTCQGHGGREDLRSEPPETITPPASAAPGNAESMAAPDSIPGHWTIQRKGTPDRYFTFVDGEHGWANSSQITARGSLGHVMFPTVWRTADGGASWQYAYLGGGSPVISVQDIFFADAKEGWVVGSADHRGNDSSDWWGALFIGHTSDGGVSWGGWVFLELEAGDEVYFADSEHGWVSTRGELLITTDGGETWTLTRPAYRPTEFLHFSDPLNGFGLMGGRTIVQTTEGGFTWRDVGVAPDWANAVRLDDAGSVAWAVGQDGRIARSTNLGATWTEIASPVTTTLKYLAHASGLNAWAGGEGGTVIGTTDGGLTWHIEDAGTTRDLTELVAAPSGDAWAFSHGLHHGVAGRPEWNALPYASMTIHSIEMASTSVGWGIDSDGVFRTTDGGATWSASEQIGAGVGQIEAIDERHAWALAGDGMYETSDAGANWTFLAPVPKGAGSLSRVGPTNAWLIASAGEENDFPIFGIYGTTDAGLTWTRQYTSTSPFRLELLTLLDAQHGWALGSAGCWEPALTLRTADGGATWIEGQVPYQGCGSHELSFADANNGWAIVSDYGNGSGPYPKTLIHTADGGATWREVEDDVLYTTIDFVNAREGWMAGGGVYRTMDGGNRWNGGPIGASYVDAVAPGEAWFAGGAGVITHYSPPDPATDDIPDRWTQVRLGTPDALLTFVDAQHGWATSSELVAETNRSPALHGIYRTDDGGASWQATSLAHEREGIFLQDMDFVSADEGWATGERTDFEWYDSGFVVHTTDGGATWTDQVPLGWIWAEGMKVSFADRLHGWIKGEMRLYRTVDGGATWTDLGKVWPKCLYPLYFDFVSPDTGFAACNYGYELFRSTDAGATWTVTRSLPEWTNALQVDRGGATVWAVGKGGQIALSPDLGVTWKTVNSPTTNALTRLIFTDSLNGWAAGEGGALLRTTDGGLSWQLQDAGAGDVTSLAAAGANAAWVFNGRLKRTQDGGAQWDALPQAPARPINNIRLTNAGTGWAGGNGGPLLQTRDGGAAWVEASTAMTNVVAIDTAGPKTAWALSDVDLQATTDDGLTWTSRPLPGGKGGAVDFVDETQGWLGAGPRIYRTDDAGLTWTTQYTATFEDGSTRDDAMAGRLWFADAQHGWATMTYGSFYLPSLRTTDGGATWIETSEAFTDFSFIDALHGWAVDYAGIYVTADGGATWQPQHWNLEGAYTAVDFRDASEGWVVGELGLVLYTEDGGASWRSHTLASRLGLRAVDALAPGKALMSGDGGLILQYGGGELPTLVSTYLPLLGR